MRKGRSLAKRVKKSELDMDPVKVVHKAEIAILEHEEYLSKLATMTEPDLDLKKFYQDVCQNEAAFCQV